MTPPETLLGLDIGGTKSAAILGTAAGEILGRREFPSHAARGPDAMLADLLAAARALLTDAPTSPARCGVSIGGPLDASAGLILSPPNLPGWDRYPLRDKLTSALGLPVTLLHDAAACALAEHRWGAGRHATRLAYLTCGTGFGLGLVLDGRPYVGAAGRYPEIGHCRLLPETPRAPTAFGKPNSAEALCSGPALGRLATFLHPHRFPTPPSPEAITTLLHAGDPDAADIVQAHATHTGHAAALLADILQPDLILLGSLARHLGTPWVDAVRAKAHAEALHPTPIRPASLGAALQDLSAIAAAL